MLFGLVGMIAAGLALTVLSLVRPPAMGGNRTSLRGLEKAARFTAAATAILVSGALLVLPFYRGVGEEVSVGSSGETIRTTTEVSQTFLEVNGPVALVPLGLTVLIATLPLVLGKGRWRLTLEAACATLLSAFVLVAGFSIGMLYLPSALSLLAAALLGTFSQPST